MLKDPKSREFAIQTVIALKRYAEALECDKARVEKELSTIDEHRHWEVLGYASREEMLAAELSDVGLTNVAAVQKTLREAPVVNERLIDKDKSNPGPGRGNKTSDVSTRFSGRGSTGATYLAARIKRDHPAIASRVEAGEFRSMRAAAIAAGIVKPKTALQQLQHWWKKANPEQRKAFLGEVTT
jgi:hypothetical protein